MANGDLFRALDQLAGVAGQEIEKARQFKLANAARLAEIARQQEQFNQTMQLEERKVAAQEAQLRAAARATERKAVTDNLKAQMDVLKAAQDESKANRELLESQADQVNMLTQRTIEAFDKGAPEPLVAELDREADAAKQRYNQTAASLGLPVAPVDTTARDFGRAQGISSTSAEGTDLLFKFGDRARKIGEDYQTVQNNLLNIEAAVARMDQLEDADARNRIATDQAVITSFNKILDPTSVVRESEYERTPANEALIRRARGAIQKIQAGGAGLTPESIREIRNTAREMAELRREIVNKKLQREVINPAQRRGLDVNELPGLFDPVDPSIVGSGLRGVTGQGGQRQGGTSTDSLQTDPDAYLNSLGY